MNDILRIGSLHGGELGLLDLGVDVGKEVRLAIPYHLLPRLANAIHQLGMMSERERYARPGEAGRREIVQAFTLVADPVTRPAQAGRLTIHLKTNQGFPIAVEVTQAQAQVLASALLVPPPDSGQIRQ